LGALPLTTRAPAKLSERLTIDCRCNPVPFCSFSAGRFGRFAGRIGAAREPSLFEAGEDGVFAALDECADGAGDGSAAEGVFPIGDGGSARPAAVPPPTGDRVVHQGNRIKWRGA
jgi:hypothetical protein